MTVKNNLKKLIRLAGLTHAEVAAAKGIAPESLSRHVSGRSQFSIQDAEDYAEILDIDPSQILFSDIKINVLGKVYEANKVVMKDASEKQQFFSSSLRFPPYIGAFIDIRESYNNFLNNSVLLVDTRPIQNQNIPQTSMGKNCIVKTIEGNILQRTVYPNPGNKFTLTSFSGATETDQTLIFSCPIIMRIERPDILGYEIIS